MGYVAKVATSVATVLLMALAARPATADDTTPLTPTEHTAKVLRVLGPGGRLLGPGEAPPQSTPASAMGKDSFLLVDIDRAFEPQKPEALVDPALSAGKFCSFVRRANTGGAFAIRASDRRLNITCVETGVGADGKAFTAFKLGDTQIAAVICRSEDASHFPTVGESGDALGSYVSLVAMPPNAYNQMTDCSDNPPAIAATKAAAKIAQPARQPAAVVAPKAGGASNVQFENDPPAPAILPAAPLILPPRQTGDSSPDARKL